MILHVDNLTKTFGARVLLDRASLRVGARDRVALVGPNGAGKTTLLEIIAGRQDADSGDVRFAKGAVIGYLEQEAIEMSGRSVLSEALTAADHVTTLEHRLRLLEEQISAEPAAEQQRLLGEYGRLRDHFEALGGYTIEAQARSVLTGLGFRESDMERDAAELSGGWLMRLALAKLLLKQPDVLLLDEPTNHLDLESVTWLEGFLRTYEGAIVVVSHDRAFMDGLVDHVADIANGHVTVYTGSYADFERQRDLAHEQLRAKREAQLKEIAHMQVFVDRFRYKNTKAKAAQDRMRRIEAIKAELVEVPEGRKSVRFSFPQPRRTGERVIELSAVSKSYGPVVVYRGIGLTLYRGDKVALVGPNGAGKSTLLKMLAGVLEPDSGARELGTNVDVAYFAQHQLQALGLDNTVYGEVADIAPDWTQSEVRRLLGAFLFSGDDVEKRVRVLSGGEKGRLALAKMLVKPAPFLCLDEPTNHLDIASSDVLEQALQRFEGTLALITHDRHLIRGVANKIVEVRGGVVTVFDGDYDYYLWKRAQLDGAAVAEAPAAHPSVPDASRAEPSADVTRKTRDQKRVEAEERNRRYRVSKEARSRIAEIEAELEPAHARLSQLVDSMADPALYADRASFDAAMSEYAVLKARIPVLEEAWLEASEEIARLESEG